MSSQVRVGIFTILALAGVVAVYWTLENYKHTGYEIGVHFKNTAGLQEGSAVQLAGVDVGVVSAIRLLPDQTAAVICNIHEGNTIFRQSTFVITTTLTGQSSVQIYPPKDLASATALPQEVQEEALMPEGTLPPTLADLATEGEARIKALDITLATVNRELPRITGAFYSVATHTDQLVRHTDETLRLMSGELEATVTDLNRVIVTSGANLQQLSASTNAIVNHNHARIDVMLANLTATSTSVRQSMESIASITADPSLKKSLIDTAANVAAATEQLKAIATDVHGLTGDPQVQQNLRGAVNNLSSAIAKANQLLSAFAGGSDEAPVERGSPVPTVPGASPAPVVPGASSAPVAGQSSAYHRARSSLTLLQTSIRETWGNTGGGPSSDVTITLLPRRGTHATFGANDLGYHTTYNLLVDSARWPGLTLSGGVLYSTLGLKAVVDPNGLFGLDARLYDPKHPKFDVYGNLRLNDRLRFFYGERNALFNSGSRTPSFGFELKN